MRFQPIAFMVHAEDMPSPNQVLTVMNAILLTVLTSAASACDDDEPGSTPAPADARVSDPPDAGSCPGGKLIYLNRVGGTFTKGPDDSSSNVASIVSGPLTVDPPNLPDAQWTALKSCLATMVAPFRITLTEVDPGTAPHREMVFVGNWAATGFSNNFTGVAPSACVTPAADALSRGVLLINPKPFGSQTQALCESAGQTLANSFGLDAELHCPDVTSNIFSCGVAKSFVDITVPCGDTEGSPHPCRCGGTEQNSYQWLVKMAGAASCP
jgi:hypothetical protein